MDWCLDGSYLCSIVMGVFNAFDSMVSGGRKIMPAPRGHFLISSVALLRCIMLPGGRKIVANESVNTFF